LSGESSISEAKHAGLTNIARIYRFMPRRREYVFVDLSNHPDIAHFHDKALNLDPEDPRAPFPAAFLMHEARARGHNPFSNPMISDCLPDPNDGDGEETHPGSSNEHPEGAGTGPSRRERPPGMPGAAVHRHILHRMNAINDSLK